LSADQRDGYAAEVAADYDKIRVQHAAKKGPVLVALADARANALPTDWTRYVPPVPALVGLRPLRNVDLALLVPHIDWAPFFQAWELAGPFPAILEDPLVGETARGLFEEAQVMLKRVVEGRWLTAHGVAGFWPANSEGDDITLWTGNARTERALTWRNLRQQNQRPPGKPNLCLADFVAPAGSGVADYVGAFAVTAGIGIERKLEDFASRKDDYSALMLKALADRLAEAFAEWLHRLVRRDLWRYAPDEELDNAALIREEYRGIRPAPGYPACPDHAVKAPLFGLLQAGRLGMSVTESFAMWPAASVSGFYLAHPDARYFAVGKIGADQLADFAARAGLSPEDARRRLAPNL
jgi:5-methyltetrahydrofolate--homocysteine methyltransferase